MNATLSVILLALQAHCRHSVPPLRPFDTITARALRAVHRRIRRAERSAEHVGARRHRRCRPERHQTQPDARAHVVLRRRLCDRLPYQIADLLHSCERRLRTHDGEFLPAGPSHQGTRRDDVPDRTYDVAENSVSGAVAERVVDAFEVVQVDGDEDRAAFDFGGEIANEQVESALETPPIERAGERVMVCLLYTSPSPRDRTRSRMPSSA